ncbi:MAG TPA: chemotaxis protein CheW [Chloroflexota bacterium]|nr:chemotaxis protein CheW [Chloroflexota bacterium]
MTATHDAMTTVAEQAAIDTRLNDRARRLAEVPPAADASRAIEVLVCRLGSEEYAIELRLLHGVYPAIGLTPVPCTPPFVAGLLNLRGEILTVLDLAAAIGLRLTLSAHPPSGAAEVHLRNTLSAQPPSGAAEVHLRNTLSAPPPSGAAEVHLRNTLSAHPSSGAAEVHLTGAERSEQRDVILAETQLVRVGLLVDEVLGVRRIALDSLDRALTGGESTRGIAEARTVLLDLEALLADRRFEP